MSKSPVHVVDVVRVHGPGDRHGLVKPQAHAVAVPTAAGPTADRGDLDGRDVGRDLVVEHQDRLAELLHLKT